MREFKNLALFLRNARMKTDLTQAEVAQKLGLDHQFASNWERGVCAPPSHAFQKLITILKIDKEELTQVMLEDARSIIMAKVYKKKKIS